MYRFLPRTHWSIALIAACVNNKEPSNSEQEKCDMTEGSATAPTRTSEILRQHEPALLTEWLQQQLAAKAFRSGRLKESELREQSLEFLGAFVRPLQSGKA